MPAIILNTVLKPLRANGGLYSPARGACGGGARGELFFSSTFGSSGRAQKSARGLYAVVPDNDAEDDTGNATADDAEDDDYHNNDKKK